MVGETYAIFLTVSSSGSHMAIINTKSAVVTCSNFLYNYRPSFKRHTLVIIYNTMQCSILFTEDYNLTRIAKFVVVGNCYIGQLIQ